MVFNPNYAYIKRIINFKNMKTRVLLLLLGFLFVQVSVKSQELPSVDSDTSSTNFFDISIEDLLNIEVTSVSKKSEKLQNVASSIYVVTQEMIQ